MHILLSKQKGNWAN